MVSRRHVQRVALVMAAVFFAGGLGWSIHIFPGHLSDLRLGPMLGVALLGVPLAVLLNAAEFIATVRYVHLRATWPHALEVTVVATAANMLPLPGGTVTRIAALRSMGASLGDGISINVLAAILWIGVSLLYAGAWMLAAGLAKYGAALCVVGIVIFVPALLSIASMSRSWMLASKFMLIRCAMLVVESVRLLLCLWSLGIAATFAQAAPLALSGVVGSAVSIVPAGVGVREAVASAIASTVGLTLSAGFLAAALNRMIALLTILPLALWLSRRGSG